MIQRILMVHNFYQQRGGEDSVVEAEAALLRAHGHEVELYARHNDELGQTGRWSAGLETLWSRRTSRDIQAKVHEFRPDLVHAHNTFPLISPSLYWSAEREGVPVVQTLHNFRLMCPQAMFLRKERVCEDCMRKVPWRSVTHRCYRGSAVQSGAVATMLQFHRLAGTYARKITRYIALTEFSRSKFITGGVPADRIVVKPNFVEPSNEDCPDARQGFVFVGRLSAEKGVSVLASALKSLPAARLDVIGEGEEIERFEGMANVVACGYKDPEYVRRAMCAASALIVPSVCYENFPRTLVEAFACRLPVIASRLGAMAELIKEGVTGLLFAPGDAADLRTKLEWALAHPVQMRRMGEAAHEEYERKYTPAANYEALRAIYLDAIGERRGT